MFSFVIRASRLALRTVPVQEEKVVESRSIFALEDIDIDFK